MITDSTFIVPFATDWLYGAVRSVVEEVGLPLATQDYIRRHIWDGRDIRSTLRRRLLSREFDHRGVQRWHVHDPALRVQDDAPGSRIFYLCRQPHLHRDMTERAHVLGVVEKEHDWSRQLYRAEQAEGGLF